MAIQISMLVTGCEVNVFVRGRLDRCALLEFYQLLLELEHALSARPRGRVELCFDLGALEALDDHGIGMLLLALRIASCRRARVRAATSSAMAALAPFRCFVFET